MRPAAARVGDGWTRCEEQHDAIQRWLRDGLSVMDARAVARHWCLAEYGLRRHSRTQRRPLGHFSVEEPVPPAAADHPV